MGEIINRNSPLGESARAGRLALMRQANLAKEGDKVKYSTLTPEQRAKVITDFRAAKPFATDMNHAVAIASERLCKTNRGWNGKQGADAFAAGLATLVMAGEIQLA